MSSESDDQPDRSAVINEWEAIFQDWRSKEWIKCGTEIKVPVACGFCSHRLLENMELGWNWDKSAVLPLICGFTLSSEPPTSPSSVPNPKHHWLVCTFGTMDTNLAQVKLREIKAAIADLPALKPWDVGAHIEYLGQKGAADSPLRRTRSMASQRLPRTSSSSAPRRPSQIHMSPSSTYVHADEQPQADPVSPPAAPIASGSGINRTKSTYLQKRKRDDTSNPSQQLSAPSSSGSPSALRLVARGNSAFTRPPPTQPALRPQPAFTIPVPSPPSSATEQPAASNPQTGPLAASRQSSPIPINSSPEPEPRWTIVSFFDEIRDGKGQALALGKVIGPALESAGIKTQEDLSLFNAHLWRDYLTEATPPNLKERFVPLVEEHVENWLDDLVLPAADQPEDEYARFLNELLSGLGSDDVVQFMVKLGFEDEKSLIGYREAHWVKLATRAAWQADPLPAYKKWILSKVIAEHLKGQAP